MINAGTVLPFENKTQKTKTKKDKSMNEIANIGAPPLDLDLNTIKTDMPLLADGIYDLQFVKVEVGQSKAGAGMLKLDLVTTAPVSAQDGSQLGAGIHVFDNLNLAPSGKATWDMVARNIGSVVQGAQIQLTGNFQEQLNQLTVNGPALLQGKTARCKVGFEPAGQDKAGKSFKAKNTISVWMKPGQ